jgi:hypothetical protein
MAASISDAALDRLPSSLYADLFYSNPGADEFRRDHLRVWMLVALESGALTLKDLQLGFETAYPGCTVRSGLSGDLIAGVLNEGLVKDVDGEFGLTSRGSLLVREAKTRYERSRDTFLDSVVNKVSEMSSSVVAGDEIHGIRGCVERLLIASLMGERDALERLYEHPDDFEALPSRARGRAPAFETCLKRSVPKADATRIIELRSDAIEAIGACIEDGHAYLSTLHRSVVGALFLVQDPHHVENLRDVVRHREYYIDTNVYLAWIYSSQAAHGIVKPLMELLRRYGVRLLILPETVEEIKRIERDAKSAALKAEHQPDIANYILRNRKAISADYLRKRDRDSHLTYASYEKIMVGVDKLLVLHGVVVEPVEFDAGEDFADLFHTFRNAIIGKKTEMHRVFGPEAVEHDADALLRMAKLQLRGQRDQFGTRVRFMSLDSALNPALEELRNATGKRLENVDHPAGLARLMLPSSSTELPKGEFESYVVSAIQQDLGLLIEMRGYGDMYLMEKLDRAGLPVRTLLSVPNHMLEPALAEIQRKGLTRKLDQALAGSDVEASTLVGREIANEIADAIGLRSQLLLETEAKLVQERDARGLSEGENARLMRELDARALLVRDKEALVEQAGEAVRNREVEIRRLRVERDRLFYSAVLLVAAMVLFLAWVALR